MQFHKAIEEHNPPHSIGDCLRTVLGCMVNVKPEHVPHFAKLHYNDLDDSDAMTDRIQGWLEIYGYHMVCMNFGDPGSPQEAMDRFGGDKLIWSLGGMSKNGVPHVVICHNHKILWDPSPMDSGIVGPMADGTYQIIILVPLSQTR